MNMYIRNILAEIFTGKANPLLRKAIPAGFPSPADEYIESSINLNSYLVSNKEATFYVRVEGDSMEEAVFLMMIF